MSNYLDFLPDDILYHSILPYLKFIDIKNILYSDTLNDRETFWKLITKYYYPEIFYKKEFYDQTWKQFFSELIDAEIAPVYQNSRIIDYTIVNEYNNYYRYLNIGNLSNHVLLIKHPHYEIRVIVFGVQSDFENDINIYGNSRDNKFRIIDNTIIDTTDGRKRLKDKVCGSSIKKDDLILILAKLYDIVGSGVTISDSYFLYILKKMNVIKEDNPDRITICELIHNRLREINHMN